MFLSKKKDDNSKNRERPKTGRLKRFLGTALLAGSLALGACDRGAVGDANACERSAAADIRCNNDTVTLYQRDAPDLPTAFVFTSDGLTMYFEGLEYHPEGTKGVYTLEDGACNTLGTYVLGSGETKTLVVGNRSFELTGISTTGQVPVSYAEIHLGPSGCDDSCRHTWECEHDSPFGYYLEEGEMWIGTNGFVLEVHAITEDVGTAPDGETCPISNIRVDMTVTYPSGESEAVELPVSGCAMQEDSCHFVNVYDVSMDVSPASGGTCEISNEEAIIFIGYPPGDSQ